MAPPKKLGQLAATAICGNDITSSCLYVSALTIGYAGQYAFVALLIVAAVLFLFRKIYGEVVGALPLNGGAYNVLLNTTSKNNASLAACLTILSYMATAVLSASEAMHYLHGLVHQLPVVWATVGVLSIFLALTIAGITESATVAIGIFLLHLTSMAVLLLAAGLLLFSEGTSVAMANFQAPLRAGLPMVLFLGFSTAMLGISGFESSANFVEEQQPGVFPKTLRNMWTAVGIINPLMALMAVLVIPLAQVQDNQEALLSFMGERAGGAWLGTLISIDATLVLCGAVLTSFVGVSGLIRRMTLDRILPQFLLKENRRGSSPRILLLFYLLCLSVLYITAGQLAPLAGVYTISFLLVMAFFALGNFLLKFKRERLPRPEQAAPFAVAVALVAVLAAVYGNMRMHPEYLVVFIQYFVPSFLIIYLMLHRNALLRYAIVVLDSLMLGVRRLSVIGRRLLTTGLHRLSQQEFVYFTKGDDIAVLNKVMMYVEENEMTRRLKVVTVLKAGESLPEAFRHDLAVLDRAYPDLAVELVTLEGTFGPALIQELSRRWKIPTNFMFIASPGDHFPYRIADLGGVRLII